MAPKKPKKAKRGRPPLPPEKVKKPFPLRITDEQMAVIERRAAAEGKTPRQWCEDMLAIVARLDVIGEFLAQWQEPQNQRKQKPTTGS